MPEDIRRALDYIAREIPKRDAEGVAFLRETRDLHFRPYKKFLPEEAQDAADR